MSQGDSKAKRLNPKCPAVVICTSDLMTDLLPAFALPKDPVSWEASKIYSSAELRIDILSIVRKDYLTNWIALSITCS